MQSSWETRLHTLRVILSLIAYVFNIDRISAISIRDHDQLVKLNISVVGCDWLLFFVKSTSKY